MEAPVAVQVSVALVQAVQDSATRMVETGRVSAGRAHAIRIHAMRDSEARMVAAVPVAVVQTGTRNGLPALSDSRCLVIRFPASSTTIRMTEFIPVREIVDSALPATGTGHQMASGRQMTSGRRMVSDNRSLVRRRLVRATVLPESVLMETARELIAHPDGMVRRTCSV